MTRFVDMNFAFGILLDNSLGNNVIAFQRARGFDILDRLLGCVLSVKGEGQDVVYG